MMLRDVVGKDCVGDLVELGVNGDEEVMFEDGEGIGFVLDVFCLIRAARMKKDEKWE